MSLYGKVVYNNWNDAVAKGDTFSHPTNGDLYVRLSVRYDDVNKIRNILRQAAESGEEVKQKERKARKDDAIVW